MQIADGFPQPSLPPSQGSGPDIADQFRSYQTTPEAYLAATYITNLVVSNSVCNSRRRYGCNPWPIRS